MSGISHALSKKAIKEHGLDKREQPDPIKSKQAVKEWGSPKEYWVDRNREWDKENKKLKKKIKDFFVYCIGRRLRDWWHNTRWYFSNLKRFQPVLKTWRSFDYQYQIDLFKFGIEQLAKAMEYYGNEVEGDRDVRISAMRELIKEIDREYEDDVRERPHYNSINSGKVTLYADGSVCFHGDASEEDKKKSDEFYAEVANERKRHYQKIFDLIIGQDPQWIKDEIDKRYSELSEEEKKSKSEAEWKHDLYYEIWDGSGIEGWWD